MARLARREAGMERNSCLVGDIGATYTRFAPATAHGIGKLKVYQTKDFESIQSAIEHYLRETEHRFESAAFAAAGPVSDGKVSLVNAAWSFSKSELQEAFKFQDVLLFNDFEAVAMAIPGILSKFEHDNPRQDQRRPGRDLRKIGGGIRIPGDPMGVMGPGTGLGVAGLVRAPDGHWITLAGEGGHTTMPSVTNEESEVLNLLRLRWGHVSAERVLSGAGLADLYLCLCLLHGIKARPLKDAQKITQGAFEADLADPLCVGAFNLFCSMLGTVAGNVALTFGAKGGLFISGGILPRYSDQFIASPFRTRFEAKGRLSAYVSAIPTYLVLHNAPALQGLVDLLAQRSAATRHESTDGAEA